MSSPLEPTTAADDEAFLDWCSSRRLWRVAPVARADFGKGTVWYAAEQSARELQNTFAQAFSDPIGVWVADVKPRHVRTVANGRVLPSRLVQHFATELIAENHGHWLALLDGPRIGGRWEAWVRLSDGPIEVRPAEPGADAWTVPPGWR